MSDHSNKILTIVISETLLLLTSYQKLSEFGWLSAKTFLLAGVAALGSLVFKSLFNYISKKFKK